MDFARAEKRTLAWLRKESRNLPDLSEIPKPLRFMLFYGGDFEDRWKDYQKAELSRKQKSERKAD